MQKIDLFPSFLRTGLIQKYKALLFLGVFFFIANSILIATFLYSMKETNGKISELEKQKKELTEWLKQEGTTQRLPSLADPDPNLLAQYAEKIPKSPELSRFLYQLHQIITELQIPLLSLKTDETFTGNQNEFDRYLQDLVEMAKNEQSGEQQGGEQQGNVTSEQTKEMQNLFLTDPKLFISQYLQSDTNQHPNPTDQQSNLHDDVEKYLSVGIITVHLKVSADDRQVARLLERLHNLRRIVYPNDWAMHYEMINNQSIPVSDLTLILFYYSGDDSFIPDLPSVEIGLGINNPPLNPPGK